jgi:oligoendopeptidase F
MAHSQPALLTFPSLPLAETASLFSEMLQFDDLLAREADAETQRGLLFGQVDRLYTGIQRQITTATFEVRAHELAQAGATLDRLADEWLACLGEQFGDAVDVPGEFRWEWLGIPQVFEWPFYVYAYTFGQLLVLALYHRYRQEGERFKPGYFRLLSAGSSAAPVALLDEAGVDVREPAFWQGGYDVIRGLIDRLEALG